VTDIVHPLHFTGAQADWQAQLAQPAIGAKCFATKG